MAYHDFFMKNDNGPIIDMTPDGRFPQSTGPWPQTPRSLSLGAIALRLIGALVLIGLAVAVFWITVFTLPLIFLGGIILYGVYRFQLMRHGGRPFGGHRGRSAFVILRR